MKPLESALWGTRTVAPPDPGGVPAAHCVRSRLVRSSRNQAMRFAEETVQAKADGEPAHLGLIRRRLAKVEHIGLP